MAVEHMVWIKFNPGVSAERIEEHMAGLRSLARRVPGVIGLRAGKNFTERANGFTHGLIVTLGSRKDLEAYLPHPEHMAVAGPLRAEAQLMAMDFEC